MTNKNPVAFVFCALACEAKPLIEAWKLVKHSSPAPFASYSDGKRAVIISGIGKAAMAGAVGYALARSAEISQPILINFGIAGHAYQNLGSVLLANKVVDNESGKRFYPQFPFVPPCPTSHLISYAKAENHYEVDSLYDMEASGFYEIGIRFSSCELIHCLKIVSDNRHAPVANISEQSAIDCCREQITTLETLIDRLTPLRQSLASVGADQCDQILAELQFSTTNSIKLRLMLQRWRVLHQGQDLPWRQANAKSGRDLLLWLVRELDDGHFYL